MKKWSHGHIVKWQQSLVFTDKNESCCEYSSPVIRTHRKSLEIPKIKGFKAYFMGFSVKWFFTFLMPFLHKNGHKVVTKWSRKLSQD